MISDVVLNHHCRNIWTIMKTHTHIYAYKIISSQISTHQYELQPITNTINLYTNPVYNRSYATSTIAIKNNQHQKPLSIYHHSCVSIDLFCDQQSVTCYQYTPFTNKIQTNSALKPYSFSYINIDWLVILSFTASLKVNSTP